jgi:hypothetical protein
MDPLVARTIDPRVSPLHRITMSSATSTGGLNCSGMFPWDILHPPVAITATIAIDNGSKAHSATPDSSSNNTAVYEVTHGRTLDRVQDADYSFFILRTSSRSTVTLIS